MADLDRSDVETVITDLAGVTLDLEPAEVGRLNAASRLDAKDLGADSLTLLELATAAATFFRLHESELEDELLRRRTIGEWTDTVMRAWEHGSQQLTFTTSGTTDAPKRCTHHWAALAQEIDVHADMFADRNRVVGLVGPRHIYGFLFCALLPRWLRVPYVDARAWAPAGLASSVRSGDLVVGFPLRWDLAAIAGAWPRGVVGVTSTGPIAAVTIATLRSRGLERMIEVYGSSETAGIAWRDDPAAPYRIYPQWTVRQDGTLLRAPVETGKPATVFDAPDVLAPREGGFDVVCRHDGNVQVAGSNVSCAHVEKVLVEHPVVRECTVRQMRVDEGARLKAFIVLNGGIDEDEARRALRAWLPTRLTAAETPARLAFGAASPRDGHGKPCDWKLGTLNSPGPH